MVQFKFTYQTSAHGSSSISSEQMKTFEMAGQIWSQYLKDDVTVNIHVGMSDQLPSNVVGGALPGIGATTGSTEFANQLINDKTSTDDDVSTSNFSTGAVVNDLTINNRTVPLTAANGKALGMVSANAEALDGVILMSDLNNLARNQDGSTANDIGWTYPNSSSSTPSSLSFLSVALHEIGHVLGFVSVIDNASWFSQTVDPARQQQQQKQQLVDRYGLEGFPPNMVELIYGVSAPDWTLDEGIQLPLDFFRYTTDSAQKAQNDLSPKSAAYFSINGGSTSLGPMSTAKHSGGDGYQASHWKNTDTSLGIMAPTLRLEQSNIISTLDLRAFDVIGWNLADSLLGSDNTLSQSELEQTFDPNNSQAFTELWQSASGYIDQNSGSLLSDRTDDVIQMIETSHLYEGKKKKTNTIANKNKWQELWQEITDIFATEARFSTFAPDAEIGASGQGYRSNAREHISGTKGNDSLIGSEARDKLVGKQGEDVLHGNDNDDLLRGGHHKDVLVGGAGSDTFVVQDKKDFDVVRDFTGGEDVLKLSSDITFGQLSIAQKDSDTLLQHEDKLLMVLRNVDATTITVNDFA